MREIFIFIILLTFSTIHLTNGIAIKCEFSEIGHSFGRIKQCTTYTVNSTETNTKISEVKLDYRNLNEFGGFSISQSPDCYYLPKEITKHFTNLVMLTIEQTGLKSITKEDLKPFENIRGLYIYHSELTTLDHDLFKYNSKLEQLTLLGNKIHYVEAGTFKPLEKLTSFYFGNSICIKDNKSGYANNVIQKLTIEVEAICKSNHTAGEATSAVKVNQQVTLEVKKESTTEGQSFLA